MIRVLVIDDHPKDLRDSVKDRQEVSDAVKKILTELGVEHEIVQAIDGDLGIAEYKKAKGEGRPFDLVVTDYEMQRVSAIGLMKEIRNVIGDKDVPVIVVTNSRDDAELQKKTGYLKPYSPAAVLNKVAVIFNAMYGLPDDFQRILGEIVAKKAAGAKAADGEKKGPAASGTPGEERHYRSNSRNVNWRNVFGAPKARNRSDYTSKRARGAKPRISG